MFIWCTTLFVLGFLAFIDSMFNMGDIFRQVNSVFFMLISLGLLIRTTTKIKAKKKESYEERVYNLEQEIKTLQQGQRKLSDY